MPKNLIFTLTNMVTNEATYTNDIKVVEEITNFYRMNFDRMSPSDIYYIGDYKVECEVTSEYSMYYKNLWREENLK